MVQFIPLQGFQYPQNAMINFAPMNQSLQFLAQNNLARAQFGLAENADQRAQEMHPLSMDYQRAQTQGLVGTEGRAQERQPYELRHLTAQTGLTRAQTGLTSTQADLARRHDARTAELHPYEAYQRWYAAAQPGIQAAALGPLLTPGMQPPTLPMPPLPQSARGQGPTGFSGGGALAPPPQPAAAPSSNGGLSFNPNGGAWQAVGQPQAPQPAAPAAQPPQQQSGGTLPNGMTREQYARALLEAGMISQDRYRQLTRDGYLGLPDGAVTAGINHGNTAGQAALTATQQVTHLQGLLPLVDQAYVGALSGSREQAANLLASLGYDPAPLLQNQSLTATALLRQGLSSLPLPVLADLRPASNTDLQFAQSVSPNMTNNPEALRAGLRALIRVRQREAMFQTLLAQEFRRDPQPDRQAILARVLQAIPNAPVLPDGQLDLGQGGQRRPNPAAGSGPILGIPNNQWQAIGSQINQQDQVAQGIDAGTIQPSTSGGTANWRGIDATAQQTAMWRLIQNPTAQMRNDFARAFGPDVLREVLRQHNISQNPPGSRN